jgi:Short C-terminal domain
MTDTAPQPSRGRRVTATALVVVASLLAFLAVIAIWANRQLLNTDNWTTTSSQLLENPVIRTQVADYLVDQLYANVDVNGQIRAALPDRLKPLAGPAAGGLRNVVEQATNQLLERPRAQLAWENANRQAHLLLLQALKGGGPALSTTNGRVVLDLHGLLTQTQQRAGIGGRVAGKLGPGAVQIEILRSDQLKSAQDAFRILKALPIVLVALSLILFGVALWIAPGWRRRAVRAYGIGFLAAGAGALAAGSLIGDGVVGSLASTEAVRPAIHATWTIATGLLREAAYATIFYGAVMVIGAWLAGPMGWAVATRRALAPYLREPAIAYGALAVLLAIVILWWAPTPAMHNPVTALVLAALSAAGLEAIRRQTAREFPAADRAETAARFQAAVGSLGRPRPATIVQAAPPTGNGHDGEEQRLAQLERLEQLRASGTLDEAEFRAEKARLLADDSAPAV